MKKDLLTVSDINYDELEEVFERANEFKKDRFSPHYQPLLGKSVGMIFAKSSTRTRISFEVGIYELGGNPIYLDQSRMQLGRGETIEDTAKVLSRYLHGIVIRTFDHCDVEELAQNSTIPVINALTDAYHPCQVLTDLFTMLECRGKLEGAKLVFYGDGQCNMANSFIKAAQLVDFELVIAAPEEFKPCEELIGDSTNIRWEIDPIKAAKDADFVYTDVWVSMGFEEEQEDRLKVLAPYQVNMNIMKAANKNVKLLHCLPAHRGEEVAENVIDSKYSIVFDQAENRLHVQKAIMAMLLG